MTVPIRINRLHTLNFVNDLLISVKIYFVVNFLSSLRLTNFLTLPKKKILERYTKSHYFLHFAFTLFDIAFI